MTEIPEKKYTLREGTQPKNITLSAKSRQDIESWAEANGSSFSAAIESLALIGLGQPAATAMAPLVASVVRNTVRGQMDRSERPPRCR